MVSYLELLEYKYFKYRTKYLQLLELIGGNYTINDIHHLFTTNKIYEIDEDGFITYSTQNKKLIDEECTTQNRGPINEECTTQNEKPIDKKCTTHKRSINEVCTTPKKPVRKSLRSSINPNPNYINSPHLLDYFTPITSKRLGIDQDIDDIEVNRINFEEEIKDKTYIYFEENYGKLIEIYYIDNCNCPVCKQKTLRRYIRSNFPLIDAVCINPDHTYDQGVKYFQIKSSNCSLYNGSKYFSKKDRFIYSGKSKLAVLAHSVRTTSINKNTLFGYICIEYTDNINEDRLEINNSKSFIVLPNVSYNATKMLYYRYNSKEHKVYYNVLPNYILDIEDLNIIPKMYVQNYKVIMP